MTTSVQGPTEGRDASGLDTEFTRGLGLYDSTMVVVGSMIGSGKASATSPGTKVRSGAPGRSPGQGITPGRGRPVRSRQPAA